MAVNRTEPDFFIIESLSFKDEKKNRFEGKFLFDYLKLLGKNPIYYYIRTKLELEKISKLYYKSEYRYLYLSCHGNDECIATALEDIKFSSFANIFKNKLNKKRIFVSACSVGQRQFARDLFSKSPDMYSLTAPCEDVPFESTYPFWTTLFYLLNSIDNDRIKGHPLRISLKVCANLFNMKMNHFYKGNGEIRNKIFDMENIFNEPEINDILCLSRGQGD